MINGKFVGLRAIESSDLPQLMAWRNKPDLRKFFRETSEINTTNQEKWFNAVTAKDSIHKMFAIIQRGSDELIGACGLCYIDWVNRSADFSIYIGYQDLYIDDTYAVESAKLMRDYGFKILNLHRLWAEIYSIDESKKAFFESLNFQLDGHLRDTYWYNGQWHDSLFFSLLKSDQQSG